MKTIKTIIRKSEHAGKVFALPVQGNSNDVKYVAVFMPHTTGRIYDDAFIASTFTLSQSGDWEDTLYVKPSAFTYYFKKFVSYLPFVYLSIGMEDGRKYVYRVPTSVINAEEGDEIEIAELSWKEFLADHEATYQSFVANVEKAVEDGKENSLTVLFYTDHMKPTDAEYISKKALQKGDDVL